MAIVERTNHYLGKVIFMRMQSQEILTGIKSVEWIDDLPIFIDAMNKRRRITPPKPATDLVCSGDSCNALEIGTKVRAILDTPTDYLTDKRLHGKFRVTDIRWDPKIRIITDILLLPGRPPLYLLNDVNNIDKVDNGVGYTKNQLQLIQNNEEAPNSNTIRGNPKTFVVQKILDKKKEGNRIYYLIRWKGFTEKDDTWEPRQNLIEDVPILIKEYEENNRKIINF